MFRSPYNAGMPPLRLMIADIPASTDKIARHLGITARTLGRYIAADQAPRAVMLGLFWETRWGRSAADCEAANYGAVQAGLAHALKRENTALRHQITRMETMLSDAAHSANAPFFQVGTKKDASQTLQRREPRPARRL